MTKAQYLLLLSHWMHYRACLQCNPNAMYGL